MRLSQLEQKAKDFATYKHEGQFRKYTGDYIFNCLEDLNRRDY